jgi:hypothetical protein
VDRRLASLAMALALVVAACAGGASVTPSPSGGTSPSPSGGTSPSPTGGGSPSASAPAGSPGGSDALLSEARDAILADLEARIGVDVSTAEIVSVEPATWPDGAMGCPRPGEVYIQVITSGYRVVVSFDGTLYDYRVSDAGAVRFCGLA